MFNRSIQAEQEQTDKLNQEKDLNIYEREEGFLWGKGED